MVQGTCLRSSRVKRLIRSTLTRASVHGGLCLRLLEELANKWRMRYYTVLNFILPILECYKFLYFHAKHMLLHSHSGRVGLMYVTFLPINFIRARHTTNAALMQMYLPMMQRTKPSTTLALPLFHNSIITSSAKSPPSKSSLLNHL
jgi:hypothetical protein